MQGVKVSVAAVGAVLAAVVSGPLVGTALAATPACPVSHTGVVTITITDKGPSPASCTLPTSSLVSFSNQASLPVHIAPADPATWPKPDPSTPDPLPRGASTVPVRFQAGTHAYTEQERLAGVPVGPANPGSLTVTAAPAPATGSPAPRPATSAGAAATAAPPPPGSGGTSAGSQPSLGPVGTDPAGLAAGLFPGVPPSAAAAPPAATPLVAGAPSPEALPLEELPDLLSAPGTERRAPAHRASALFQGSPGRPFGLPAVVAAVLLLGVGFALARTILAVTPASGVPGGDPSTDPQP
jgi:hypothetical protein